MLDGLELGLIKIVVLGFFLQKRLNKNDLLKVYVKRF